MVRVHPGQAAALAVLEGRAARTPAAEAALATGAFEHAWSEGEHMARSELIAYAVAAG